VTVAPKPSRRRAPKRKDKGDDRARFLRRRVCACAAASAAVSIAARIDGLIACSVVHRTDASF
jgi:hypothetical protein